MTEPEGDGPSGARRQTAPVLTDLSKGSGTGKAAGTAPVSPAARAGWIAGGGLSPGAARHARPVILDITRSLKRVTIGHQTGIDRVERAYLTWGLQRAGGLWLLAAIGVRQYLVPPERAAALAASLSMVARLDEPGSSAALGAMPSLDLQASLTFWRARRLRMAESAVRRAAVARSATAAFPLQRLFGVVPPGAVLVNVGHDNLPAPLVMAARRTGLRIAVMLHDLIPITHPEYSRPAPAARFATWLEVALRADLLLSNSSATAVAAQAHAAAQDMRLPPIRVLPLGIGVPEAAPPSASPAVGEAPYFVMLGTIEGRKNHLLLLALWRGLSTDWRHGEPPHLHIVGRRGWAADQVFDMLDRAPVIGRSVFEHADLDDAAARRLVEGARALLLPSFVEGYGLPVGEALAAGVPVIASDLPALREVGGTVPEWLDPLDGTGWLAALRDYARPGSPRRAAQMARMDDWQRPTWRAHFARLDALLAEDPALRATEGS
ncbi:MAG: glycosyltransferase [Pseudomonadota bacterium]